MRTRLLPLILCVFLGIILIFSISGCSNEPATSASVNTGTTTSSPTNSATTTATPPATTPTSTTPAYADELLIFAAAGTKAPIDEAAILFEQKYGTKVTINYGGGGEVLSNMVIAQKGDIYIAPEQRFMDSAKKQGAIDNDVVPTSLAYMIPVLGVQKGNPQNIQTLADLAKSGIRIVIGNAETTALGDIVPVMLQKAGLYDEVKPNIVTTVPQVNAIITSLKMNQVDVGVIWHYFGTVAANDIDIVWINSEYVTAIGEIQAVVTNYSQESATAKAFIDLLTAQEGKDIFQKNGYIVDRQEADGYWSSN